MTQIRVYFEGHRILRTGFEQFFRELVNKAHKSGVDLSFIAGGPGPKGLAKGLRSHPQAWNILLKDSEQEMPTDRRSLCESLGIRPEHSTNVFWMVQLMEAWFLADPDALASWYGTSFRSNAIGQTQDVEHVPKRDVYRRLEQARRDTGREYAKSHAVHLLGRIRPERVRERAAHCREFFDAVERKLAQAD
ncbi:MAG TPA: DUF4276 family protein [Bryobacteraceae bacterium]|nr:DUF4276 family protein [Bryobacteraceae bacterium]